jgi:hypothetical protein
MSNDLIQSIKNELAGVETGLDEDTLAVAGGTGSNKRISIKGGVFRKFANGKEVGAIEDRFMNIIFVKMAHAPSRTYYSKAYEEGTKLAPECWSSDSKTPDAAVKTPRATACDKCEFSVKGSAISGQGTACRLSWRTAVVLPNDPKGDVLQLVLPAASVFGKEKNGKYPFRAYMQYLASNNISAGRVVTKMQFDTDVSSPKVVFSAVAAVPQMDADAIKLQAGSSNAANAVKLTVFQPPEEEAAAPEVAEPTLRDTVKTEPAAVSPEIAETIKKWSKK